MDKKLKARIDKVRRLAEQATNPGEKEAAELKLDALLAAHHLTLEDVTPRPPKPEYKRYKVLGDFERKIFHQCVGQVFNWNTDGVRIFADRNPTLMGFYATPMQHKAFAALFKKYKTALMRDMAFFFEAWLSRQTEILMPASEQEVAAYAETVRSMSREEKQKWLDQYKISKMLPENRAALEEGLLNG